MSRGSTHARIATAHISPLRRRAAWRRRSSRRYSPILSYARKLTLSPARMTAADAASVYDAGWDDDALYSTVLVTALFNFYNRLVDGVGLALPEGYEAEAGERLSTQGYDVFAQMAKPGPIAA